MKERWAPVRHGYYKISNMGNFCRVKVEKYNPNPGAVKAHLNKYGYLVVQTFYHGRLKNHRMNILVANAFLGPCPLGKEVHHKDHNKQNNRWDNLEYVTAAKNSQYESKLNVHKVHKIRKLYALGDHTQKQLAEKYEVHPVTIWYIVNNKTWKEAAA